MLLANLLFGCALAQSPAPATSAAEHDQVYDRLDVLNRLLAREVVEHRAEISGEVVKGEKPEAANKDPNRAGGGGREWNDSATDTSPSNVFGAFNGYRNAISWGSGASDLRGEYVPGLAVVLSMNVRVKTNYRAPEREAKKEDPHRTARDADEEAWDQTAREMHGDRSFNSFLFSTEGWTRKGANSNAKLVTVRFDDAALAALKSTLIDGLARFGHRLELSRGERIALVVRLTPTDPDGRVVYGDSGRTYRYPDPDAQNKPEEVSGSSDYSTAQHLFWSAAAGPDRLRATRLVIQVSADDLRAHQAGQLGRDELERRARSELVGPGETTAEVTPSNQAPRKQ